MIGTMKAIGSSDGQLRRIFLWVSFYIVGRGVLLGNAIGIGLVLLQQQLHLVPLERASYYIDYVPVLLDPLKLLLLTGGTLAACVSLLVLPTLMIRKVQPVSALRFS
jgi:lipoprotein-releasing system permease protein